MFAKQTLDSFRGGGTSLPPQGVAVLFRMFAKQTFETGRGG